MRRAPRVYSEIKSDNALVHLDLKLSDNHLFVIDESASGKSFVASLLRQLKVDFDKITVFDYTNINDDILQIIKSSRGRLFVIDNANIILGEETRRHIAFDFDNQYLIFGSDASNLMLTPNNFAGLNFDKNTKTFTFCNWEN